MSQKHTKFMILIILLALLLLSGCQSTSSNQKANHGVLDLTGWDFDQDGIARLDGKWEFYRQQLISPGENFSDASLTGYYAIPGYWTGYDGLQLSPKSYATYRLFVKLDGGSRVLSISTPDIYTEYKLWVNGELIGSNLSAGDTEPTYLCPKTYEVYSDGTQMAITLQIINNRHIYAGVGQSILLGSPSRIHNSQTIHFAIDFFLSGICLLTGLYHLVVFVLRKKGFDTLYFSLLCFSAGVWTMFFNETLIMRLFPYLAFSAGSRIVTLTMPLCVISMILYTQTLYREDISNLAVKGIVIANLLYTGIVLLCKPYTYLQLFVPYLFSIALVCLYGIYIAIRITMERRPEYHYYIAGIALLAIGALLNILEYLKIIDIFYCLPYSVVLFIFLQTIVVGKRYLNVTRNAELLASNLENSLHKIENTETAFLNAQIKPHFLYNALNTIAQCCQSDPEEAEELILNLSKYLRGTLNFENLGNFISLKKELELVASYYQIEKARFENIHVEFHVDETLNDCSIPPLMLQPLVENAIKHGIRSKESDGLIKLEIRNLGTSMVCTVEDNGAGIGQELLPELLSKPGNTKNIGLYNIHARLLRLYGKGLTIRSTVGVGTVVQFEIPF